ncbi:MAG: NifU family protein [Acidimicrobiales bacterium]
MDDVKTILSVSQDALAAVKDARLAEPDPELLGLWIEVNGDNGSSYTYDVYFEELSDISDGDMTVTYDDVVFVVPSGSVTRLQGATLDLDPGAGLVLLNPNVPERPKVQEFPPEALSSELAQRVIEILADEVNPSIAAHGGRADLMGVVDGVAYLALSGGCQGCGLASVTLSQGIALAIQDALPEITNVVDVTDHASGSNPFYAGSKK